MPRPLAEQVIVITGASSGIGRETATLFAKHGASLVLAARNESGLNEVAQEVEQYGGNAQVVVTDVGVWEQVEQLAKAAVDRFGRIDTWVNNAGISVYSTVEQMTVEEFERVIQVNVLGVIYGTKAALPYMKQQNGGTIINISSGLGERAVPLQSAYCASKHAVKGFTESFRMELRHDHSPIEVTLILPSSINTPFFDHARSRLGSRPGPVPPVYQPSSVAKAIVSAAQHPKRDIYIGSAGKFLAVMEHISPALTDRLMLAGGSIFKLQKTNQPDNSQDNLFSPMDGPTSAKADWLALPGSPYTRYLELHPNLKRALMAAGTLGALVLLRRAIR